MSMESQVRSMSEAMDLRPDWSDLPSELWPKIAKSLHNHVDLVRFRSVCKSWRSSIPSSLPNSPSLFPFQIPHPINPSKFVFLSQSTIYRIESPHQPSSSHKGWLIKLEGQSNPSQSHALRLLNPLSDRKISKSRISSRRILNLLDYRAVELYKSYSLQECGFPIKKVVFFPTSCWSDVNDSVACCIYQEGKLALFKRGDNQWRLVDDLNYYYDDVIVYKGQLYVTDRWGTISWIDTSSLKLIQYSPPLCGFGHKKHLVESCGNLFVVDRYYDSEPRRPYYEASVVNFKVYRLDEEWGTWVDVKDLEDRVFILGNSCNLSVSANDFAGYAGNCIFFIDIFDVRVYNLGDGSTMTLELDPCTSKLFWPPPSWLRI
ncbi:F-box protein SKIP23-like [Neltuma alba]|uniref:F-box protein SKIP23-like n=1 Tax=Neltuma alba TaxID=207710 RepID=UPI0010A32392|nr:F-box protein SKIP23-like [Prosopis alba]XP_028776715.1 F-box protein SKIP23-like [Prosopis alba]